MSERNAKREKSKITLIRRPLSISRSPVKNLILALSEPYPRDAIAKEKARLDSIHILGGRRTLRQDTSMRARVWV